jgi:hypothetical protein
VTGVKLAIQLPLALMFRNHGTVPSFLILRCVIKHSDSFMVHISTLHVLPVSSNSRCHRQLGICGITILIIFGTEAKYHTKDCLLGQFVTFSNKSFEIH